MVLLAANPDRRFSNRDIATKLSISEAHLSKVLQRLGKLDFVNAIRGPNGGFKLGTRRKQVTLLDIYEAIEGPLGLNDCLSSTSLCRGEECIFGDLLVKINTLTRKYLEETALTDLCTGFSECNTKKRN